MIFDSFIDYLGPLGYWFRPHNKRNGSSENGAQAPLNPVPDGFMYAGGGSTSRSNNNMVLSSGPFAQAHDFTINHSIMAETVNTINMFSSGSTVLQLLAPYTTPDAAVDSSARWPPPACHPGTRETIKATLETWLDDAARHWSMMWVYGSAGCGKSAVAQTFAEHCADIGRLGAAYLFSRPNKRNNPNKVIPTIAYQLALRCADYRRILTSRFAEDPLLLSKTLPVQFKSLLVEPFTYLQRCQYEVLRKPFVIVLDGLDECRGKSAQCEFIKLINELVRLKRDFPLLWLICSRPEAHLQFTFSRMTDCGREELEIDEECRDDVNRYLRDGLYDLQVEYGLGPSWPPKAQFDVVSESGSGLFVFVLTALDFIGDEKYANSAKRLDMLVAFLINSEDAITCGPTNPLAKLDLLYSYILADIPEDIFPTTWRILANFMSALETSSPVTDFLITSAQALCNFLDIEQHTFYGALRQLHSLIQVPPPEEAATSGLHFYHDSFQDFLIDPTRSKRFVIQRGKAVVDMTKSLFYWYEIDSRHFHAADDPSTRRSHDHAILSELKWISRTNAQVLSENIATFAELCWYCCARIFESGSAIDRDFVDYLHELDFRYFDNDVSSLVLLVNKHARDLTGLFRAEPSEEVDNQLLDYLEMMTDGEPVEGAAFPLRWVWADRLPKFREYLLGHGKRAAVVWLTQHGRDYKKIHCMGYDQVPSQGQISEYQRWLTKIQWYDEPRSEEEVDSEFDGDGEPRSLTESEDSLSDSSEGDS